MEEEEEAAIAAIYKASMVGRKGLQVRGRKREREQEQERERERERQRERAR